ncbi:MAG: hypothetical protein H6Q86_839 [candidate division NC10 bacterium]|jgi:hypothetical protein|nr:hypothetical protein [candidate division NC10 bacterium]
MTHRKSHSIQTPPPAVIVKHTMIRTRIGNRAGCAVLVATDEKMRQTRLDDTLDLAAAFREPDFS